MPKFLDLLTKRIWKTNLDDQSRAEIYREIQNCSEEVCNALDLLAEKLKQRKICRMIKEEVKEELEVQTGTHGESL